MLAASVALATPRQDAVVLLHGLGRTSCSMSRLARELEADGYQVVNLSYPSRSQSLEALAHDWLPARLRAAGVADAPAVHFVTHSMGGIVVRLWLRDQPPPTNLGCIVMLAPPNAGSEVSDHLDAFPPFRWFTGANGRRLGTRPDALPAANQPARSGEPVAAGGFHWMSTLASVMRPPPTSSAAVARSLA
jgi:alpha-beta hydrolase superfamily lysophospholipase